MFPLNDDRFNQKNDDTDIGIKNENALALIKVLLVLIININT